MIQSTICDHFTHRKYQCSGIDTTCLYVTNWNSVSEFLRNEVNGFPVESICEILLNKFNKSAVVIFSSVSASLYAREVIDTISKEKNIRDIKMGNVTPVSNHDMNILNSMKESTHIVVPGLSLLQNFISVDREAEILDFIGNGKWNLANGFHFQEYKNDFPNVLENLYQELKHFRPDISRPDALEIYDMSIIESPIDQKFIFSDSFAFIAINCPYSINFSSKIRTARKICILERHMIGITTGTATKDWECTITSQLRTRISSDLDQNDSNGYLMLLKKLHHEEVVVTSMPTEIEKEHVHSVYDNIAPHFSHTRHHPWPLVKEFLLSLDRGSFVADIGCGNGKYYGLNNDIFMIGSDRSIPLLHCCQEKKYEVFGSDALKIPVREDSFDAAICIALLHHLSTIEHRLQVLRELARIVKVSGRILLVAWAFEQDEKSKRRFTNQDEMVEWKLQSKYKSDCKTPIHAEENKQKNWVVYQRYCHLYLEKELKLLIDQIPGLEVRSSQFSRCNWCIELERTIL